MWYVMVMRCALATISGLLVACSSGFSARSLEAVDGGGGAADAEPDSQAGDSAVGADVAAPVDPTRMCCSYGADALGVIDAPCARTEADQGIVPFAQCALGPDGGSCVAYDTNGIIHACAICSGVVTSPYPPGHVGEAVCFRGLDGPNDGVAMVGSTNSPFVLCLCGGTTSCQPTDGGVTCL